VNHEWEDDMPSWHLGHMRLSAEQRCLAVARVGHRRKRWGREGRKGGSKTEVVDSSFGLKVSSLDYSLCVFVVGVKGFGKGEISWLSMQLHLWNFLGCGEQGVACLLHADPTSVLC